MSLDLSVLTVVETLYGFLDRSPTAVLLLDGHKRIVYANDHAAILDVRCDGISLSAGCLALLRQQDHSRLEGLLTRALAIAGSPGSAMRALRPSGKRPYGIFVAPVFRRNGAPSAYRPAVCVVITDPDGRVNLPVDRLHSLFDLTEAEGRLAALLAAGEDLRTAARRLGITYGTARARLSEIFQKTETCRQGELINLLLTTLAIR